VLISRGIVLEVVEVGITWPSEEARESYIRFLELELLVVKRASEDRLSPTLLNEFDRMIRSEFPRTSAFIGKKMAEGVEGGISDEIRTFAWAEARSERGEGKEAKVRGRWTPEEVSEDINECFREAARRADL
jgi:hypothetical protein